MPYKQQSHILQSQPRQTTPLQKLFQEDSMPELFTKKEAAKFLQMSVVSLDRLRQQGLLRYRRLGGQIRFLPCDLEDFIIASVDGGWERQVRGAENEAAT